MLKQIKKKSSSIIFFVLVLTLIFMIIDTIPLPLHATIVCGEGLCICYCVGESCKCNHSPAGCYCWCNPGASDECVNPGHDPDDLPRSPIN